MAKTQNIHVLIDVDGHPRRLFSIAESKSDRSVMLIFLSASFAGEGLGAEYEHKPISHEKYSIHPSDDSPQRINKIQHTIKVAGVEKPYRAEHYTAGLKIHNQLVPILAARSVDLAYERYKPRNRATRSLKLGSYDPRSSTLVYSVFVGNMGKEFIDPFIPSVQTAYLDVGDYRVVVVWEIISELPSFAMGTKVGVVTLEPPGLTRDEAGAALREVMGLEPAECVKWFQEMTLHMIGTLASHGQAMEERARAAHSPPTAED